MVLNELLHHDDVASFCVLRVCDTQLQSSCVRVEILVLLRVHDLYMRWIFNKNPTREKEKQKQLSA